MGTSETRMNGLVSYYMDIEQELQARENFPNTSQNKKRIIKCKEELETLWGLMNK